MATSTELMTIAQTLNNAVSSMTAAVTALIAAYHDLRTSTISPADLDPVAAALNEAVVNVNAVTAQIDAATTP